MACVYKLAARVVEGGNEQFRSTLVEAQEAPRKLSFDAAQAMFHGQSYKSIQQAHGLLGLLVGNLEQSGVHPNIYYFTVDVDRRIVTRWERGKRRRR